MHLTKQLVFAIVVGRGAKAPAVPLAMVVGPSYGRRDRFAEGLDK